MAEVFLSYAREDTGRAKALAGALERAGRSVWWDRNIEGGSEYSVEIDEELKQADAVVVLWSAHSVGSAWVRDEAASGRDSNRLVPVKLDDAEAPLGFRQFQTIDLSRWKGRDGPGLKTLKSAVAAKVARSGKLGVEPATPPGPDAFRPRWMLAAVAAAILAVAALTYIWATHRADSAVPSIAIVRAASGGDVVKSNGLARSLSVELGGLQTGSADHFELRDPAGGTPRDVDYLVEVAVSDARGIATAELSLLSAAGRQILWTSHLEKSATQGDLRVPAAARLLSVLECLAEASGSGERLDQPVLKLFLRGCEKFRDEIGGMPDPTQLATLREVVHHAPRFAPAIAHLALIEVYSDRPDAARALIAKAKALNPKLGKIYLAEANLVPRSQWSKRQAILVEGLKYDSNSAALNDAMAFELGQVGRGGEALTYAKRARELDPMSPVIQADFIQHLMNSGQTEAARKELQEAEGIWPTSTTLGDTRYAFDMRFGDPANALRLMRENAGAGFTLSTVGVPNPGLERFLLARIDPTPQNIDAAANAYLERFRKDPADAGSMILSLGLFGRVDQIFEAMTHPVAIRSMKEHTDILFRPYMLPMLHDRRFMQLAARFGLVRYWTETGKWPDFCLDTDLPYDCKIEARKFQAAGKVR